VNDILLELSRTRAGLGVQDPPLRVRLKAGHYFCGAGFAPAGGGEVA